MTVDQNTKLFASFAAKAGSFGCRMHNFGFQKLGVNAIYKSFSVADIGAALKSMLALGIEGAGVTMPYKLTCLECLDELSPDAAAIGAANTIIARNGRLVGHNTDCIAATETIAKYPHDVVYVLGNGGYGKAVAHAARSLRKGARTINRKSWNCLPDLRNSLVYNCTPVENIQLHESNTFIDCNVNTRSGMGLAVLQGAVQFKMYTGIDFPQQEFIATL